MTDLVDEREVAIFATVGWGLVPLTQNVYEVFANVTGRGLWEVGELEKQEALEANDEKKKSKVREKYEDLTPWNDDKLNSRIKEMKDEVKSELTGKDLSSKAAKTKQKRKMKPFRETKLFQIVDHISQASKLSLSLIVVDCASLIGRMMGYDPWNVMETLPKIYSKVAITGW